MRNIERADVENLQKKIDILLDIAIELNRRNIIWAIGGSLLLYFKGMITEFRDIDIMVAEKDAEMLKEVILKFGDLQPPNPHVQYKTKCFLEFTVEDVDIDVMAGFTIVNGEKEYYFPLRQDDIQDYTEIKGIMIPLQAVAEWRNYYELMGRTEKVKIIDCKMRRI